MKRERKEGERGDKKRHNKDVQCLIRGRERVQETLHVRCKSGIVSIRKRRRGRRNGERRGKRTSERRGKLGGGRMNAKFVGKSLVLSVDAVGNSRKLCFSMCRAGKEQKKIKYNKKIVILYQASKRSNRRKEEKKKRKEENRRREKMRKRR